MTTDPSDQDLKAALAWEKVDRVSNQPEVTAFKRRARYAQSLWREQHGIPTGTHEHEGVSRPLGSRIEADHAESTGDNFLYPEALEAVRHRLAHKQHAQMLAPARLWRDLLSSMPMCFNLFGECWADHALATAAMSTMWPAPPGTVEDVRFEWSPGRLDPRFLNNKSAFDVAFLVNHAEAGQGIVGVETKYHEHANTESRQNHERLARYVEVTENSGVFAAGAPDQLIGTDLQQLWLDHLLVLSMLQAPGEGWAWGRFVLVAPARNPSFAEAAARYQAYLIDDSTFAFSTIEEVLAGGVLTAERRALFEDRYLW